MKTFCLLIILFSPSLWANTKRPYVFHYINKNIKLSPESFRRYVRPQIKGIIQDFFLTLKRVQPVQEDLIEIMRDIFELEKAWGKWKVDCEEEQPKCQPALQVFYERMRKLDKMLLNFRTNKLSIKNVKKSYQVDSQISLSHSLDQIATLNYKLLHFVEEILITSKTPYALYSQSKKEISPLLHKMLLQSEMIITGQLDRAYRKDFEAVWNNFIKSLEKHVLKEGKIDYLLTNLEKLNTSWNSFHMRMSKTNRSLPESSRNTISFMHNRWNSILKIILRN